MARPVGVVVSMASVRDENLISRSRKSSSIVIKSRKAAWGPTISGPVEILVLEEDFDLAAVKPVKHTLLVVFEMGQQSRSRFILLNPPPSPRLF
jgi:hypothetical protein